TYMPDPRSDSIDHSNNNYEAIDLFGFQSDQKKRGGEGGEIRRREEEEGRRMKRKRKGEERRKEGLRTSPTYCPGLVMNSSNGS
ncbi:hypothetical protein ALC62_15117, partial [Cyphomyrmex costatus]